MNKKSNLIYYCKICKKIITYHSALYGSGLCKSCSAIERFKDPTKHPMHIDGRSLKLYKCKVCKKEIGWQTVFEGSGMCRSCSCKERLKTPENNSMFGTNRSGENNPMFGKKQSKLTKEKISKTRIKRGIAKLELNPNWLKGISFEPYTIEFSNELREKIRERDNHECQFCHTHQKDLDRELCVHHIDYNKQNCKEENLVSLCLKCHIKSNFNRDYYYAYFTYKLGGNDEKMSEV